MARICPKTECTTPYTHGHGGDEMFLSRVSVPSPRLSQHGQIEPYTSEPEMPDFIEDTTSVRGPGWGTRICPYCGHETFGGLESVTKEAMWEHFERCLGLHSLDEIHNRVCVPAGGRCQCPEPLEPTERGVPSPGSFDDGLYAAFLAGANHERANETGDTTPDIVGFWDWREGWQS